MAFTIPESKSSVIFIRSFVIISNHLKPYTNRYVMNWWSGEKKMYGVLHVIHFSYLGLVPDTKNSSISPLG